MALIIKHGRKWLKITFKWHLGELIGKSWPLITKITVSPDPLTLKPPKICIIKHLEIFIFFGNFFYIAFFRPLGQKTCRDKAWEYWQWFWDPITYLKNEVIPSSALWRITSIPLISPRLVLPRQVAFGWEEMKWSPQVN